jgi:hypothetical protein
MVAVELNERCAVVGFGPYGGGGDGRLPLETAS